jgi:hypothetical protein
MATKAEQFKTLSAGLIAAHERLAVCRLAGTDSTMAESEVSAHYSALEAEHMPVYSHDEDDEECNCVACGSKRSAEDDDEDAEDEHDDRE